jgi:hypothetical protein
LSGDGESACFQRRADCRLIKMFKIVGALRACAAMKPKYFLIRADPRRFLGRITRRGRVPQWRGLGQQDQQRTKAPDSCIVA